MRMEGIFMNINFNTLFQRFLPLIYLILLAFILNCVIFFFLPTSGVDFAKNESLSLNFKKYNFYSNTKDISRKDSQDSSKQTAQSLSKYNLKAIYYTSVTSGWIIIEETTVDNSHILSYGEKIDGYMISKLFKNYVLFEKDKKEYKLKIKEKEPSQYEELTTNSKQEIIVKDNGAVVSRDYLNSYITSLDKIWSNISVSEIKNGELIDGFKIDKIKKDSAFEKIGLKEGDIIKAVNNSILSSHAEAFKVFDNIGNTNFLNIEVLRNNEIVELNYEIN